MYSRDTKDMKETRRRRKKIGYNINAGKSYLIVKDKHKAKAIEIYKNTHIKITTEGKRPLGSVIGSKQFSENYISSLVAR